MVRIHVGQPFDSGLAALGLRSWQAIRGEAGVVPSAQRNICHALSLPKGFRRYLSFPMLVEISCPDPIDGYAFVYILESADGTFDVGQPSNIRERLRKHRLGLASKHTRDHPDLRLVYVEGPLSPTDDVRRERQLKGWSRAKKSTLVSGNLVTLKQLSRPRL